MNEDIIIEKLDFNNQHKISQILVLLNNSFKTNFFNNKWWKWKYIDSPFGTPLGWIARNKNDNTLLGLRLLWPWIFKNKNEIIRAYQCVDAATNPDYTKRGIFSKLLEVAITEVKKRNSIIFTFPNENSFPIYLKLNWKNIVQNKWIYYPSILNIKSILCKSKIIKENILYQEKVVSDWDNNKLKWRFLEHPTIKYYKFRSGNSTIFYKKIKRLFFYEAIIVYTNISSLFSLDDLIIHFLKANILYFKYNGVNTSFSDLLKRTKLAFKINRKMNYVCNDFNSNNTLNELKLEFAETDFG